MLLDHIVYIAFTFFAGSIFGWKLKEILSKKFLRLENDNSKSLTNLSDE